MLIVLWALIKLIQYYDKLKGNANNEMGALFF